MEKTFSAWQYAGFIFTAIAGILLHFAYDWSSQSILFAPFAAINESIWEHMKLLFFPMFIFALIEYYFWGNKFDNFWCVKNGFFDSMLDRVELCGLHIFYTGNSDF